MSRQEAVDRIAREFATAEAARQAHNGGMMRVCARRASGIAIAFWLQTNVRQGWGIDAMSQLSALQADEAMPAEVRDAAQRLTTRVTEQFTSAHPANPLDDCTIIVQHLLRD